jgi:glucose uptake protein GlcU
MRGHKMKTLATLGLILSTLGGIYLLELIDTKPTTGIPLTIIIGGIYVVGVLIESRKLK